MNYNLSISGIDYEFLKGHLYPGDNKEAVAIALCGWHAYKNDFKLLVHKVVPIQYDECEVREPDQVKWSTESIRSSLVEAMKKKLSIVKFHSHPTGYPSFSSIDDKSDLDLFQSIFGWMDGDQPHGSVVMLPDGKLFGRIITYDMELQDMNKISVVGNDIKIWFKDQDALTRDDINKRTIQAFGQGTTGLLKKLKVGVIGCSGTGSPTVEQLVRLGVGQIVLIDPDKVELKNLNRIVNTTIEDANEQRYKVQVLGEAIEKFGLGTKVQTFNVNLFDSVDAIKCLSSCDILFGCMDSVDGRHLLNQIATFYLIPYFDIGVKIIADGKGGIDQLCGTVNYLQPGGSSLKTRGVYTSEDLRAAGIFRSDTKEYEIQKESGYIVNVNVDSPAVISLNFYASSIAVNELLARIHCFRYDGNKEFAIVRFSLTDSYIQREVDGEPDDYLKRFAGRGDLFPLLNMPELSLSNNKKFSDVVQ
jgi:hypothetical protein